MKTKICVLAALLAVAATVWAGNPAYWSARYGGWSKEPACDRTGDGQRCWVLTLGKDTWNREAAGITYTCRADKREWLNLDFWAAGVVDTERTSMTVRWDSGHEEKLETWLETGERRGKPIYWFNITDPQRFLTRATQHDRLTVELPYRDHRRLFVKAKFPMQRVIRSIKDAMAGCNLTRSNMAGILNQ